MNGTHQGNATLSAMQNASHHQERSSDITECYAPSSERFGCRASSYQHLFYEIPYDYEILCNFDHSLEHSTQEMLDLQDQLMDRIMILAPTILTDKQFMVFKMYFIDGLKTPQIAHKLDLNTSTIQQRLYGIKKNSGHNVGAIPQLRKVLNQDTVVLTLLSQIKEILSN